MHHYASERKTDCKISIRGSKIPSFFRVFVVLNHKTNRRIPFLRSRTLKLMSNPIFLSANFI